MKIGAVIIDHPWRGFCHKEIRKIVRLLEGQVRARELLRRHSLKVRK